jgi:hypothetical protein
MHKTSVNIVLSLNATWLNEDIKRGATYVSMVDYCAQVFKAFRSHMNVYLAIYDSPVCLNNQTDVMADLLQFMPRYHPNTLHMNP